ncbi:methyl-accepting chemotaxis protein [Undibacterium sp. SXout20W]|uniref:methyl-accepting chemotaxis protein n=1 Tax=Undibacterium sp. SXout20W TaxID=3413051 RepID=UPI003BF1A77A
MPKLISPAIRLMQGFRIGHKVAFVATAFAIPLFVVVALLFSEMQTEVAAAKKKQTAIQQIQEYQSLQSEIRKYRALVHMQTTGNKQIADAISANKLSTEKVANKLSDKGASEEFKKQWQSITSKQASMKSAESFAQYSKLLDALHQKITSTAYSSKLALDSDFTTHELAGIYLTNVPSITDKLSVMAGRGAAYIDSGLFEAGEDVTLNSLQMLARQEIKQLTEQTQSLEKENPSYKANLDNLRANLGLSLKFLDRAQDEVLASVNQSSGNAFLAAGQEGIDKLFESESALSQLVNARLESHITELNHKIFRMFGAIIVLVLLAGYFLLGIYFSFARDIAILATAIAKTADGDLQHTATSDGKDELAQLINAIGKMNLGLSNLVDNIRTGAENINNIAKEIYEENIDLASRTEHQAGALQQTASSVEELTSTIKENAGNLSQASSLIDSSAESVQHGLQVMEKAITTMQDVTATSRKISEIIGVMDGIAFQTNILALNAAVEAARAGQEGRGFAVVASEVRNLAQRSANAAKEIKGLIVSSGEAIQNGSNMINTAGKTMREIAENVDQVTDLIKHVSSASQEQSAGISNVNEAINSIDEITQHNAALVEQASKSTNNLEGQASELNAAVSVFKTQHSSYEQSATVKLVKKMRGTEIKPKKNHLKRIA